jgi:hypothetical protein
VRARVGRQWLTVEPVGDDLAVELDAHIRKLLTSLVLCSQYERGKKRFVVIEPTRTIGADDGRAHRTRAHEERSARLADLSVGSLTLRGFGGAHARLFLVGPGRGRDTDQRYGKKNRRSCHAPSIKGS